MGVPFTSETTSYSYRQTSSREVMENGRTICIDVVMGVNLHISAAGGVDEIEIYKTETT